MNKPLIFQINTGDLWAFIVIHLTVMMYYDILNMQCVAIMSKKGKNDYTKSLRYVCMSYAFSKTLSHTYTYTCTHTHTYTYNVPVSFRFRDSVKQFEMLRYLYRSTAFEMKSSEIQTISNGQTASASC